MHKKEPEAHAQLSAPPPTGVTATAEDSEGRAAHENASFTTSPVPTSSAPSPYDGTTVGVARPVSINFDKAITNKAEVQKDLLSHHQAQEVACHWFNANRMDCRPRSPGGLPSSPSSWRSTASRRPRRFYGVQQKTVTFKIGRNNASTSTPRPSR
ncbi:Lipoprotein OS=Streptomyces griseomycini OX=66895 GN=FHS37_001349 PE=4 SV=1 [Streptomyces griseomycini]